MPRGCLLTAVLPVGANIEFWGIPKNDRSPSQIRFLIDSDFFHVLESHVRCVLSEIPIKGETNIQVCHLWNIHDMYYFDHSSYIYKIYVIL